MLDVTSGPNPTATGNVLSTLDHPGDPSPVLSFSDQADTDVDIETLTVTAAGRWRDLWHADIAADGSYTYTLNSSHADVNALDDGETLSDTYIYTVSDGTASRTATLTITIFGTNEPRSPLPIPTGRSRMPPRRSPAMCWRHCA